MSMLDHDALHSMMAADPATYDIGMLKPLQEQLKKAKANAQGVGDLADVGDIELAEQVVDKLYQEQCSRLDGFAARAMEEFQKQVRAKKDKEQRMIDDERRFEGLRKIRDSKAYPNDAGDKWMADLERPGIHQLRNRTLKFAARLSDMCIPSDELPIKIDPQPKPDPQSFPSILMATQQMQQQGQQLDEQTIEAMARTAADKMQGVVETQLREQDFPRIGRDVILDACKYGYGVSRGPTVEYRNRKKPVGPDSEIKLDESPVPGCQYVDPWMFYYDMARTLDDCSLCHVVHLMDRRKLTKLRRYPRMIEHNIDLLLEQKDPQLPPDLATSIRTRNASTDSAEPVKDHWAVIEMHGVIDPDELEHCMGIAWTDKSTLPLIEFWFCDGRALKWKLTPMEMNWRVPFYNCTPFPCDDTIMGNSIPYLGSSGQKIIDGAVDATLSNASIASGPFIAFRKGQVKPMDDTWTVKGPKTLSVETDGDISQAIYSFTVPANVEGNLELIQFGQQVLDQDILFEEIADDSLSQEGTPASGLLQIINLQNVFQRMIAARMDGTWFKPMGDAWVQWNNQFNPDVSVKGDYDVKGVASTTLVAKDLSLQHTQVAMQMSAQPQFAGYSDNYELLASYYKQLDIPNKDKILFPKQVAMKNQAAQSQQGGDPAKMAEIQLKQQELELKKQEVALAHQERMAEIARQQAKDQSDAAANHENNYTKMQVALMQKQVALIGFAQQNKQNIQQFAAIVDNASKDNDTKRFLGVLQSATDLKKQGAENAKNVAQIASDERSADKDRAADIFKEGMGHRVDAVHKVADQKHDIRMAKMQHAQASDLADQNADNASDLAQQNADNATAQNQGENEQ